METPIAISRTLVPEDQRLSITERLFGLHFPFKLEPSIYTITENLTNDYKGGYWDFYALSNSGFYMALDSDQTFHVICMNGFEGELSGDALGITTCLYAYSHLSFSGDDFAEVCGEQYHLLREFMLEHAEAKDILRAID